MLTFEFAGLDIFGYAGWLADSARSTLTRNNSAMGYRTGDFSCTLTSMMGQNLEDQCIRKYVKILTFQETSLGHQLPTALALAL